MGNTYTFKYKNNPAYARLLIKRTRYILGGLTTLSFKRTFPDASSTVKYWPRPAPEALWPRMTCPAINFPCGFLFSRIVTVTVAVLTSKRRLVVSMITIYPFYLNCLPILKIYEIIYLSKVSCETKLTFTIIVCKLSIYL